MNKRLSKLKYTVPAFALMMGHSGVSYAQSAPLVNVCTGISVDIPVLTPVVNSVTGLLGGLLDPVLNALVGGINTNLVGALSGQNIGATVLDTNGNLLAVPGDCGLVADSVQVDTNAGISMGGGSITGLGGPGNTLATAGEINSIAVGNGAATSAAAANSIALGLRGAVTAADGVALGRDATVTAAGGLALGAGSVADRAGLAGQTEALSGAAVGSTAGALSVGAVGSERQITNVAGGTQDTDAVNLRQLGAVSTDLATVVGGGSSYDTTTKTFVGPTYNLRGGTYTNIGDALTALDNENGTVQFGGLDADNTAGAADAVAAGGNAVAVAFGSSASGSLSSAVGAYSTATAANSTALGSNASATAVGGVALGAGAVADRAGMNGQTEVFSGVSVGSTAGAVSVGSAGAERQIANVAGGTQDTDAVNLRQLKAVSSTVATVVGGNSYYDTVNNVFVGPTYNLRGGTYTNIGDALTAIDITVGAVAADNTAGAPLPTATGANAVAVAYGANASGAQSSAFGSNATASGSNSTAVGSGASATYANSTALGAGATTTRANQIAIGTASNTYTLPGISSAASRAAQSGPTKLVTTDAAGNLATTDVDLNKIQSAVISNRREMRRGVAAAMAMSSAPTPSAPGKTTWATNVAQYHGEFATSFAVAHMLDTEYPVTMNAALSFSPGEGPGVRVGLAGEF